MLKAEACCSRWVGPGLSLHSRLRTAPRQQKLGLHILATANGAFNRLKDNLIITARRDVMNEPEFCRSCVG
jgi:hypothetical protein